MSHDQVTGDYQPAPSAPNADPLDSRIGAYILLEKLGEGGMGAVWLAEQTHPVKRQVALKTIKAGIDSRQFIARFEQERQALAIMEHPNIARVYDAGTTEDGRPYFVMELVTGQPITKYCDQHRLGPRERLELFIPVGEAVQHAHQKGIIHRDLKPSNVLVTEYDGRAVPKVIDFGVAKVVQKSLMEEALQTEAGALVGTLEYMSPEQAEYSNLDIDTRADVYSLGVMLYELLTGSPPFSSRQLRSAALAEMLRIIREVEPAKPSTRVSSLDDLPSIAANRRVEPRQLASLLHGDLDWILMKCLEKERDRRYESALSLVFELRRYLMDEPVLAGPPTVRYRLGKFIRRHKWAVGASSLLLLSLLSGVIGTTWGMLAAREERDEKEHARKAAVLATEQEHQARLAEAAQRKQAEAVASLLESIFSRLDPYEETSGGLDLKTQMTTQLEDAVQSLELQKNLDGLTRTRIRSALAKTMMGLGLFAKAADQLMKSWEEKTYLMGFEAPDVLITRNDLAVAFQAAGHLKEASSWLEESHAQLAKKLGPKHEQSLIAANNLALARLAQARYAEAINLFTEVREHQERTLPPSHPDRLKTLNNLALASQTRGRNTEAIELLQEVRRQQSQRWPPEHPEVLRTDNNLAAALRGAGRHEEALRLLRDAQQRARKSLPPSHPFVQTVRFHEAATLRASGKPADALPILQALHRERQSQLGLSHLDTLLAQLHLAGCLTQLDRGKEALPLIEEVLDEQCKQLGPEHPTVLATLNEMANLHLHDQRPREAIRLYEQIRLPLEQHLGRNHPSVLTLLANLGTAQRDVGLDQEAGVILKQVHTRQCDVLGIEHPSTLNTLQNLAFCRQKARQFAEAIDHWRELVSIRRRTLANNDPLLATNLAGLGYCLLEADKPDEAVEPLQESLTLRDKFWPDDWRTYNSKSLLGDALLKQKKVEEAERLLITGHEGLKQQQARIPLEARFRLQRDALQRLVQLYQFTRQSDKQKLFEDELKLLR